jgi:hypothetical protein
MAEPPPGITQASARVVDNIVGGLVHTPTLLLIVVLNIAMIVAAGYYLARQEDHRVQTVQQVTELLKLCIRGSNP